MRTNRLSCNIRFKHVAPLIVAALTACNTAALACPCADIPKPLSTRPEMDGMAGVKFTQTKAYKTEFLKAIADAKAACSKYIGEPNIAIISDIDETLLDNRPEIERESGVFRGKEFHEWIETSKAPVLKPTADFLAWARANGFAIFLLTGRFENQRRATIENLLRQKVAYDGLYVRANNDHRAAEDYKTEVRKNIEAMGFKIVVNLGDQDSDLYGGHAEDCEKLPNKMYYIP